MDSLATLPRRSWLERTSLALAVLSALVGVAGLWETWLQLGQFLPFLQGETLMRRDEALAFAVFGFALLAHEFGLRSALWSALLPLLVGLRGLVAALSNREFGLAGFFDPGSLGSDPSGAPHLAAMTSASLVLGAGALFRHAFSSAPRSRLFTSAFAGSLIASVGFSTLFGYAADLPAIYRWGTDVSTRSFPPSG